MAKKVLNIAIEDRLIKVSLVSLGKSSVNFQKAFYFLTPDNTVSDGYVSDPELLGVELKRELTKHGVSGVKAAVFVLSSSKLVSREVSVPPMKPKQIGGFITANASDFFPIDLTNYVITHSLVGTNAGEDGGHRVQLTAAPNQLMQGYLKLAETAGLALEGFDHVANAQYQLFKTLPTEGVTMYVSISPRQTYSTFMRGSELLLQRSFPFGGDALISMIMASAGMEEDKYGEVLESIGDKEWLSGYMSEAEFKASGFRIINGVERSVEFFKSTYKGMGVDRIVLLDTCGSIAGLRELLNDALEIEVKALQEMSVVTSKIKGADASFYATCTSGIGKRLDLMPDNFKRNKSKNTVGKDSFKFPIAISLLLVVAGGALTALSYLDYLEAKAISDSLTTQISAIEHVRESYTEYVNYSEMRKNLEELETDGASNAELRAFLEELEQKMPSNLLLLSATCDDTGVSMNIQVETMEDAAVVISQLRSFESIHALGVSAISEQKNDLDISVTSFSVVCSYYVEDEEEVQQESFEEGSAVEDEFIGAE